MMTKLADELEALAKDATPGPWRHELEGSSTSRIRGADDPNFSRMAAVIMDRGEANAELIIALFNNLPIIITALRQPDAVPGDLVERTYSKNRPPSVGDPVICMARPDWNIGTVQHISDETRIITCGFWADHGYFQVGKSVLEIDHAATYLRRTAAAIQSLTAERDALQQALADTQGAMTLTAEIGVTYFDQRNEATAERDAALACVAALVTAIDAPRYGDDSIWDDLGEQCYDDGPLAKARALLEGSKP